MPQVFCANLLMRVHSLISPAGLKARGLRIKGDDSPLMPGEFRDVDVPGGAIRDSIAFLPYKEPSSVLYQLLGNIVEEGEGLAPLLMYKLETSTRKLRSELRLR